MSEIPSVHLRLYVAGRSLSSVKAIDNIQRIQEMSTHSQFEVEIIDIMDDASQALADGILVTPTLIKFAPLPSAFIVGDLTDADTVLRMLNL